MSCEPRLSESRREVLRQLAALPVLAGLAGCTAATNTAAVATLHGDGVRDDSPALAEIFAGRAVMHRGRLRQFNRRPPPGTYFLNRTIEIPSGVTLTDSVFYAWVRPAIVLAPGAALHGCWTCLAPVAPTGTGPAVVRY